MRKVRNIAVVAMGALATVQLAIPARAEVSEVVIGAQYGALYLPAMVMESEKIVEKQLASAGMAHVKVTWARLGTASAINDATISGALHFSCQGVPSTAVIWDKTQTTIGVKAVAALASSNLWLNTRNPNVRTIKDFTTKDRIALPGLKVAGSALALHYISAQTWGIENYTKLDSIVVSLPHPTALAAVLNPASEINSHFASSPFHEIEIKGGMRTIATNYEIWGGTATSVNFVSSETFRTANPKVYAAVERALSEAMDWINADKRRAAAHYLDLAKEKRLTVDELVAAMNSGDLLFTRVPNLVGKQLDFMHQVGLIKAKPRSWKDIYLPEAVGLPGN